MELIESFALVSTVLLLLAVIICLISYLVCDSEDDTTKEEEILYDDVDDYYIVLYKEDTDFLFTMHFDLLDCDYTKEDAVFFKDPSIKFIGML